MSDLFTTFLETPLGRVLTEILIYRSSHHLKSLFDKFKDEKELRKNFEQPWILLNHRRNFRNEFLFDALRKPTEILFVTIMSKHTIQEIKTLDDDGNLKVKKLKVLTLKHCDEVDQVSESLSKHINESPVESITTQINAANNEWRSFSTKHRSKIEVREYESIPTMQGFVVKGEYALVELLTYHSQPNQRAAILAKKDKNPELFKLFSTSFEKLWRESKVG